MTRTPPQDRRPRIAVLDDYMRVALDLADWSNVTAKADLDVLTEPLGSEDAAAERLRPYDAVCLLRERTAFPRSFLKRLPNLKAIAATGRQNRTLDLAAAEELGIVVMTTSGSGNGVYATVELAWGLVIAALRHIPQERQAMTEGAWQTRLGSALYGRTIGIVGLGRLGTQMAKVAGAFGMEVLAWSPNLTPERAAAGGARLVSKIELFQSADVVSLHLVLGPSTRGIIGAQDIARMRTDAILVNTARGPLVDESALVKALRAGQIAGAGIDVYDGEPLRSDHPLRGLPNAICTPHLGYAVRETLETFYRETVENLEGWLEGRPPRVATSERS